MRVREQLMLGASQIKLTAGGGVSSPHSPLDVSTFTEAELRAAVEAAENWGTYVTVHAYTPAAVQRAIAAGVQCIEHGHLMDEARPLIADKGVWLSIQPLPDELEDAFPPNSEQRAKAAKWSPARRRRTSWRRSTASRPRSAPTCFSRRPSPAARRAAGQACHAGSRRRRPCDGDGHQRELLALSGKRNPYPGKLGVVDEGALADLLLVDGDPLENIALVADPARNFLVIMKDGVIYKNTLQ